MSWFRKALSISTPEPGSYYTAIDPLEFYEWRYKKTAPKGSIFTSNLPPSDIFTEGMVIASAQVSEDCLDKSSPEYKLKSDSYVDVKICAGHIPSAIELLTKYKNLRKTFDSGLDRFKEDMKTRIYVDSQTDDPHLFRMSHFTDDNVTMNNFGPIEELIKTFAQVREALSEESMRKKGRSFEMEEFRRYDNVMTFTNNSHLHVDASKMDRLLKGSGIKSKQTKTVSWKDCYVDVSAGAKITYTKIRDFESMGWVQDALKCNV